MSEQFERWLDKLSATAVNHALGREYQPTAYLRYADGHQERMRLSGGGQEHAQDLRGLAVVHEPAMIALITEAWTIRRDLDSDDPDVRRLVMGELQAVRDLPSDKQGEMLQLYGEEAASGDHQVRAWYIVKDARGRKRLRLEQLPPLPKDFAVRFWPVFVVDDMQRRIERGDASLPIELRAAIDAVGRHMDPEEKRLQMRKVLALFLLQGGGATSRDFEQRSRAFRRTAIDYFAHQAGPARPQANSDS